MAQHLWDEEFCFKAVWALLALAPAYGKVSVLCASTYCSSHCSNSIPWLWSSLLIAAVDIGKAGIIQHLIICMFHNKTYHDLQVTFESTITSAYLTAISRLRCIL
jgi:hypothetical protein